MENRCFIVGAGDFDGFLAAPPRPGDLIIAADGGYRYLRDMGVEPDVLLGDFDSLEIVPEHRHLIRHSPIKDDTDMALAVAYAKEEGYRDFFLYGGLGGKRLDHTIANLQLLTGMAREGLDAYLIGSGTVITAITNGKLSFPQSAAGMISVFCMGEQVSGVFEHGLKYTLENAVLTCDRALGVSNEFIGEESCVEVRSGTILVMWDAKNGLPERAGV